MDELHLVGVVRAAQGVLLVELQPGMRPWSVGREAAEEWMGGGKGVGCEKSLTPSLW